MIHVYNKDGIKLINNSDLADHIEEGWTMEKPEPKPKATRKRKVKADDNQATDT